MIEGIYIYIGESLSHLKNHQTYLCTERNGIVDIWREDSNNITDPYSDYITSVYLETFHKFFITLADFREERINQILDDE